MTGKQQLAQARGEWETTADYAQGLESWQITARTLLEALTKENPVAEDDAEDCWFCVYCDGDGLSASGVDHSADCPWLKARAFLAEQA